MAAEDPRLARLTAICLALPEVTREVKGPHAAFLVGKKKFAYFLNDHHGDGIVGVTCKVLPGDNDALVQANPSRFYRPAYLASSGWVALRLDRGKVDWTCLLYTSPWHRPPGGVIALPRTSTCWPEFPLCKPASWLTLWGEIGTPMPIRCAMRSPRGEPSI